MLESCDTHWIGAKKKCGHIYRPNTRLWKAKGCAKPFVHLQVQQPPPSTAGYPCPKDVAGSTVLLSGESSAQKMRRREKVQLKLPHALERGRGDHVQLLPKRCEWVRAGSGFALSIATSRGVFQHPTRVCWGGGGKLNIPAWQVSTAISVSHSP